MTELICGVDEAGRGPGAGPVVAAAVILPADFDISGLDDSKKLTAEKRDALFDRIISQTQWSIGMAEPEEIDRINILHATMAAMQRA
ncbi:MAG: ribonuclease HII, partial [Robiginitomaculum sp.]|nr:ribonuclease HII [Robiginitomaculum sp.]